MPKKNAFIDKRMYGVIPRKIERNEMTHQIPITRDSRPGSRGDFHSSFVTKVMDIHNLTPERWGWGFDIDNVFDVFESSYCFRVTLRTQVR
jgi:hypothetical protein